MAVGGASGLKARPVAASDSRGVMALDEGDSWRGGTCATNAVRLLDTEAARLTSARERPSYCDISNRLNCSTLSSSTPCAPAATAGADRESVDSWAFGHSFAPSHSECRYWPSTPRSEGDRPASTVWVSAPSPTARSVVDGPVASGACCCCRAASQARYRAL